MSPFTVLILCIQACLIQTAFGQALCGGSRIVNVKRISQPTVSVSQVNSCKGSSIASSSSYGNSIPSSGYSNSISSSGYSNSGGSYGGQGTGQVACAGDISAAGNTIVTGAVPVIGSVSFSGTAPASGSVSITGQCGCSCSN